MTNKSTSFTKDITYLLTSILIGLFLAQFQDNIQILPIIGLVLYLYTNLLLKRYWFLPTKFLLKAKQILGIALLCINSVLIFYFGYIYSPLIFLILFILSILIQSECLFMFFELHYFYTFIYSYIFIIIFNLLTFYFQLHYISLSIFLNVFLFVSLSTYLLSVIKKHIVPHYLNIKRRH